MCNKKVHVQDCFQVHPFIVDMVIKSDTSAIKIIVHWISKYYDNDAYILYVCIWQ